MRLVAWMPPKNCPSSPLLQKIPPAVAPKMGCYCQIWQCQTKTRGNSVMQLWTFSRKNPAKYIQLCTGGINHYVDLATYGSSSFSFEIFGISPEKREIFANRIRQCWQNHTFGTTKNKKIFCQCSYSSWNKVSNVIFEWILFISKLSDSTIYFFNYSLR